MKVPGVNQSKVLLVLLLVSVFGVTPISAADAAGARVRFKDSYVPAWFDGPDDYKHYDVDVMVQDMDLVDEINIKPWKAFVDRMHARGKLFFAEMRPLTQLGKQQEYLMSDPGMQEAVSVDFNLNPIKIPWMLGRAYKGHPVYFYCSNNPRYRAYLRQQIFMYAAAGADAIMVDDGGGAQFAFAHGGCFCPYCRTRFREYLAGKYTPEQLASLGIRNLDSFDYREVVLRHADNAKSFRLALSAGEIPLADDYDDFLKRSDAELFASLQRMASKLKGGHMPMGWDNVDFGGNYSLYYDSLDVFYSEINYQHFAVNGKGPDEEFPPGIIFLNKLSDALGKWFIPTPAPSSWTAFKTKNLTGLLQQWIAFSYANGGPLRYPRKGWCFGNTSRWYYPPKAEFEPIYDFVRKHRELLDDYEAVAQVGVLYTQNHRRSNDPYYGPLKYVCAELVNRNIPFGVAVAGDDWLKNRLRGDEAARFELMLVPEPLKLVDGQQEIVDRWKREKRAVEVRVDDDIVRRLGDRIDPLVAVEGDARVWLFPRRIPNQPGAAVVCHVVNRRYEAEDNRLIPQENVPIRLREALWGGKPVRKVTYYTIAAEPRELRFDAIDGGIRVSVPKLVLWGILRIET